MKNLLVICFLLLLSTSVSASPTKLDSPKLQQNGYIVVLQDQPLVETARKAGKTIKQARSALTSQSLSNARQALQNKREQFKQSLRARHKQALVVREYDTLFNGLGVRTDQSLQQLQSIANVKAVYPVSHYKALLNSALPIIEAELAWQIVGGQDNAGKDIRIAIIDSGIIPNHPMFSDTGMTAPSSVASDDYCALTDSSFCNNKIILARHYPPNNYDFASNNELDSPMAIGSHGTHVAAIAAGREVVTQTNETISGVAPAAYLYIYKALWGADGEATDFELLKAIEDAFNDGADVINNSWGGSAGQNPASSLYQNIYRQLEANDVVVVTAAGNDGEQGEQSINCPACVESGIAVAATTTTRAVGNLLRYEQQTILSTPGDNHTNGVGFAGQLTLATGDNELGCNAFAADSLNDQVVLIKRGECFFQEKAENAQLAGAKAMIVYNNIIGNNVTMLMNGSTLPATFVSKSDGELLIDYINTNNSPEIAMDGNSSNSFSEAAKDNITSFSSLGPNGDSSFIKPDMAAPGNNILAAFVPEDPDVQGQQYGQLNGTSMASPMVAGSAALLKQHRPNLSAQAIKFLLINSVDGGVMNIQGDKANAFETGSGRLNVANALALVAHTTAANIAAFDCGIRCAVSGQLQSITNTATNWTGQITFQDEDVSAELSSQNVTIAANDVATYEFTVELPIGAEQTWYHGELTWISEQNHTIRQAIVVANNNENSDLLSINSSGSDALKQLQITSSNVSDDELLNYQVTLQGPAEFVTNQLSITTDGNVTAQNATAQSIDVTGALNNAEFAVSQMSPFELDLSQVGNATEVACQSGCDEFYHVMNFNFPYMGDDYQQLTINDNGVLLPGRRNLLEGALATNYSIPSEIEPNNIIAPFWIDFDLDDKNLVNDAGGGSILWLKHAHQGDEYLIVQWHQVQVWIDASAGFTAEYWGLSSPSVDFTFQAIIRSHDGQIWYRYLDVPEQPNFYTIGLEDDTGKIGHNTWFDGAGSQSASTDLSLQLSYQAPQQLAIEVPAERVEDNYFAQDDELQLSSGGTKQINVLENDLSNSQAAVIIATVANKALSQALFPETNFTLDTTSISIIEQPLNGTVTLVGGGVLQYTPNSSFEGNDSLTYSVSNSLGNTSQGTLNITVGSQLTMSIGGPNNVDEDSSFELSAQVANAIGNIDYLWQLPDGLTSNNLTGENITIQTPNLTANENFTVSLTVSDSQNVITQSTSILLLADDDPPALLAISGPDTITDGTSASYTVSATDPDSELSFQWQLSSSLSSSSLAGDSIQVTATGSGTGQITALVSDGTTTVSVSKSVQLQAQSEKSSGGFGLAVMPIFCLLMLLSWRLLRRH